MGEHADPAKSVPVSSFRNFCSLATRVGGIRVFEKRKEMHERYLGSLPGAVVEGTWAESISWV